MDDDRPLRLLWVVSKLEPDWSGGVGRVVAGASRALAARGHDVHLAGSARTQSPAEIAGVVLHLWPTRRRKIDQLVPLVRLQRELRADLVHFHSALPHGAVILPFQGLGRVAGAPRIFLTPYTGARSAYPKGLSRAALARADGVVLSSEWSAAHARAAGARPHHTHVVPAGVDLPPTPDSSLRLPSILILARLVPSKGVDVLLEAFAEVASSRRIWCLRIAGVGRDEDRLRARVQALNLVDRVEFLGVVSGAEKSRVLAEASLGVVPSRDDNYPGSLLELQAHGVPCIATRVGGIPEIADQGRLCRLVPPGDSKSLAVALSDLMDAPDERRRLGEAARQAAAQRSWDAMAARLEAVYRGVS